MAGGGEEVKEAEAEVEVEVEEATELGLDEKGGEGEKEPALERPKNLSF